MIGEILSHSRIVEKLGRGRVEMRPARPRNLSGVEF